LRGHTLNALSIDGDAVLVDLAAYEITDVEAGELRHLAQGHAVVRTPTGHAWFALP